MKKTTLTGKKTGKLIIFAAPSGAGKTTIVRHLLKQFDDLAFSISATTRKPRIHEKDGEHYYYLSPEKFRELTRENALLEWEEVYKDQYYGTLRSEVERLWAEGKHIIFDIDVKGALNIKKAYQERALSVFVKPPTLEILFERLTKRATETVKSLEKRKGRAKEELEFENLFDRVLVNDVLEKAKKEAEMLVRLFIDEEETHDHENAYH